MSGKLTAGYKHMFYKAASSLQAAHRKIQVPLQWEVILKLTSWFSCTSESIVLNLPFNTSTFFPLPKSDLSLQGGKKTVLIEKLEEYLFCNYSVYRSFADEPLCLISDYRNTYFIVSFIFMSR